MPTPTYTALATLTLTGSASSVTFSSISQAYADLVLVANITHTLAAGGASVRMNGVATGYKYLVMAGNGSTANNSSSSGTGIPLTSYADLSNTSAVQSQMQVMDYASTNKNKSTLTRTNKASQATEAGVGQNDSTSAVTTISVYESSGAGAFAAGSTFSLYGIAA